MERPGSLPYSEKNTKAIEGLLGRVRSLNPSARARLLTMLNDEMDLPYLDMMEREYAKLFRTLTPTHAIELRGRFVKALNEQRGYLVGLVRNILQECGDKELQPSEEELQSDSQE